MAPARSHAATSTATRRSTRRRARGGALEAGRAAHRAGRLDEAERHYRRVLAREPGNADALNLLGAVAYQAGDDEAALAFAGRALALRPRFPEALHHLGSALLRRGELDKAEVAYRGALDLRPGFVDAIAGLGAVRRRQGRPGDALCLLRAALALDGRNATVWTNLGAALLDRGEPEAAADALTRALVLCPDGYETRHNLGNAHRDAGRFAEAVREYRRAYALEPRCVDALGGIASVKRFAAGDPDLELFRQAASHAPRWSAEQKQGFFFAWGKALDDAGRYDDAFLCLSNANAVARGREPYDVERDVEVMDRIGRFFAEESTDRWHRAGCPDETPVFVLGMPRSGTTLVEQVLASHPAVHGGGELTTLADIVREQAGLRSCTYPRVLADLEAAEVSALGAEYVRRLRALAPGALRVTDKMPGNFRFLGLIRLALPGARIIHCRRNPVDTCLSCYQQNFHEGHAFTNDLTDLGRYYRAYARLMEQWRRIFPGQFLEVDYEGLVTDFERESRRMLEFAGLPWDDACLRFHQTPRSVDTASRWQVRQPLYRRSVERRRNYERHLGPLREALGDAAGG